MAFSAKNSTISFRVNEEQKEKINQLIASKDVDRHWRSWTQSELILELISEAHKKIVK
jgi:hypothetical protein